MPQAACSHYFKYRLMDGRLSVVLGICFYIQLGLLISTEKYGPQVRRRIMAAPCLYGYFACNSTNTCVEQRYNCDGVPDCVDGSDEWQCDDILRVEFWNSLLKKRVDEDRENRTEDCELTRKPDVCKCSEKSLFCENAGLEAIPENLDQDIKEIDLSASTLKQVEPTDFPFLEHLEILILRGSKIQDLSPHGFRNLPNLRKLYLSANLIRKLDNFTFEGIYFLDLLMLSHNPLHTIEKGAFQGLERLEELDLRNCELSVLHDGVFDPLPSLRKLFLDNNHMEALSPALFYQLHRLQILSLSRNKIKELKAFWGCSRLRTLSIYSNAVTRLDQDSFGNFTALQNLDLQDNRISTIQNGTFSSLTDLRSLNLKGNAMAYLPTGVFHNQRKLTHVYFSDFRHCLSALHARICEPKGDGISSVEHLLDNILLRICVWIMAAVACSGNLSVLLGRLLIREPNRVHSLFIKNLAISDFLMGVYLIIIAVTDIKYREVYILHEYEWRHSWQCSFAGFLSTLSCEASVLIVTIITLDRYFSIVYPLVVRRRSIKFAWALTGLAWSIAFTFSSLPLLPIYYFGSEYYGSNGVCLPFHIHNPFSDGWEYSLFIFCIINSLTFILVFVAYLHMFVTISKSASGLRICSFYQHDRVITKRFAFIVGFQFVCWIPIMIIKFIALSGIHIDEFLYAWLAVFLLPVNSALNPVLYTLTTRLFRQQFSKFVYSWRSTPSMTMDPLNSLNNRNHSMRMNFNSSSENTSKA